MWGNWGRSCCSSSSSSSSSRMDEMLKGAKPYLGMLLLQVGRAGSTVIVKFSLNQGMNSFTFSVYRCVVATIVFAPFAIALERKVRPKMTMSIFLKIMLLGLIEPVIDQNLFYTGMKYTTATFSAAMCNILPAITFLMAWAFRLEKVKVKSAHSQAKMVGTLVTVGGAMIMTLVKGPVIGLPWTSSAHHHHISSAASAVNPQDFIKGALMITASCFCWAIFFILQAITLKTYPAELSLTSLICTAGALQGVVLTFIVERGNTAIWALHWDSKLLSALYSGIINSGVGYYISGVVMREKGPVFVSAFNPLTLVIVAIMSSIILSEQLYLGSVLGSVVIIIGLYLIVWGKAKDQSCSKSDTIAATTDQLPIDQQSTNTTTGTVSQEISNGSKQKPTDQAV